MRVAIVGSREYPNLEEVVQYMGYLKPDDIVVSGGARGVDRMAEDTAKALGLTTIIFEVHSGFGGRNDFYIVRKAEAGRNAKDEWYPYNDATTIDPQYPTFGAAAYVRNRYIVEAADEVVAFYDGKSKGTRNTIALAGEAGKLAKVFRASPRVVSA